MSNFDEHQAEQAEITAMCEAGECDHPECSLDRGDYWYENRHDLEPDMVFRDHEGDLVKLDRRVPGDGTQWYVADMWGGSWAYMDSTIEPGDLRSMPVKDPVP